MSRRVQKTLALDPDVVEAFSGGAASLSETINALLREAMERRTRQTALTTLVAGLDAALGEPDHRDVDRFAEGLS